MNNLPILCAVLLSRYLDTYYFLCLYFLIFKLELAFLSKFALNHLQAHILQSKFIP